MSLEHSPAGAGASFRASDASLTIGEFCQAEKMSRSMLYRAWSEGWGPTFYWVGVTRRITYRARLRWQREREAAAAAAEVGEAETCPLPNFQPAAEPNVKGGLGDHRHRCPRSTYHQAPHHR